MIPKLVSCTTRWFVACWLLINWAADHHGAQATVQVLRTNDTYEDRASAFTPSIVHPQGLVGVLIPVETLIARRKTSMVFEPANEDQQPQPSLAIQKGCQQMEPPRNLPSDMPWFALVERGGCSFQTKVQMMQASGASAVIVGDHEKSTSLITMFATEDTSSIHIPASFTYQWAYRDLRYQATQQTADSWLVVRLTPSPESKWPVVDVIVITIVTPVILMVFMYSLWRFRNARAVVDGQPLHSNDAMDRLMTMDELDQYLPIKFYDLEKRKTSDPDTCAICLEDFQDMDELRCMVHCVHQFHSACIDQWLTTRKRYCPICKQDACPAPVSGSTTPLSPVSSVEGARLRSQLTIAVDSHAHESDDQETSPHIASETTPLLNGSNPIPVVNEPWYQRWRPRWNQRTTAPQLATSSPPLERSTSIRSNPDTRDHPIIVSVHSGHAPVSYSTSA